MKFHVEAKDGASHVKLIGRITSDAQSAWYAIDDAISEWNVVFDCEGVDFINSHGANAWIKFHNSLRKRARTEFVRCSTVFISYAEVIKGFIEGARVKSFFAPYGCRPCQQTTYILIEMAQMQSGDEPVAVCANCGAGAEPEIPLEELVGFVAKSCA